MELNRPLATVTPTLDGDVLAVLAQHEVSFTTGQLRRVLSRYSQEGIRKVLIRLTRQGVVSAERVGNSYSYRLNAEHLAARQSSNSLTSRARCCNGLRSGLTAGHSVPPTPQCSGPRRAAP